MFNNHFGLESAVLEGSKTRTTRLLGLRLFHLNSLKTGAVKDVYIDQFKLEDNVWHFRIGDKWYKVPTIYHPCKVGEIVAIKQPYNVALNEVDWVNRGIYADTPGWTNKMFVRADLMPHHVQIADVKIERMQNISNKDCLEEGIFEHVSHNKVYYMYRGIGNYFFDTPRDAYSSLIDRVCGKGTWDKNPWVIVYYFKLIK